MQCCSLPPLLPPSSLQAGWPGIMQLLPQEVGILQNLLFL
jgi:hypothetical protein